MCQVLLYRITAFSEILACQLGVNEYHIFVDIKYIFGFFLCVVYISNIVSICNSTIDIRILCSCRENSVCVSITV